MKSNPEPNALKVHISIDDIGKSFRWLTVNRPKSLFDMRLYGQLKTWHEKFGAVFTLYCFALVEQFLISEIPADYSDEFKANAHWLKFGFHGKCGNYPFAQEIGYRESFELVEKTIERLGAGKTNILRLHSWQATPDQKKFLFEKGVSTLLYPDDDCLRYDSNDKFTHCSLTHWRTRVWLENIEEINDKTLHVGREQIFAFTHEWCFEHVSGKFEEALKIYRDNGYEFID